MLAVESRVDSDSRESWLGAIKSAHTQVGMARLVEEESRGDIDGEAWLWIEVFGF